MSISITKISKRILLGNKRHITPGFSSKTAENSIDRNTVATNSQNENKSNNDISKKDNLSLNIIIGKNNKYSKCINKKEKQMFSNKNNKKVKKLLLKYSINKNCKPNNEILCPKKVCNNRINNIIIPHSYKSKKKNNDNKNIFIDKLINNKFSLRYISKNPLKQIIYNAERKV